MKIYLLIISTILISICSSKAERVEMEWDFPNCGTSILNNSKITKVCATRDFIAQKPRKRKKDWLAFLAAEGSSGYKGPRDPVGGTIELSNQELNLQGHVWDFSQQGKPSLILRGHDSIFRNGTVINAKIYLGGGYRSPNFSNLNSASSIEQLNSSYAKKDSFDKSSIEGFTINNINFFGELLYLSSWNGGVLHSNLILNKSLSIDGSKAKLLKNKIISQADIQQDKTLFTLDKSPKSSLTDISQQIFPDQWDDKTTIPNVLYIKFSPDTIIDGSTFTLTKKNDQAYAIVLDHSPRVRITNNTFNGFKVPILMDQWSSIVDEKGKEIKPENFTGYGNVINPDKFAGNVTMNRKGEIVRE